MVVDFLAKKCIIIYTGHTVDKEVFIVATKSISKNIYIRDNHHSKSFVRALEKAKDFNKPINPPQKRVVEVKSGEIKDVLGLK